MNLDSLISQAQTIEDLASKMQPDDRSTVPAVEIQILRNEYSDWYTSCLSVLIDDLEQRFRAEYEGTTFSSKIRQFLSAPNKPYELYIEGNSIISYWHYPYENSFQSPFHAQKQILIEAKKKLKGKDILSGTMSIIDMIARRFPLIVQQLRTRHNERSTIEITDEYDVQDLFHALLKLFFDDVRAEDTTERYGAKSSRIDFVLKQEQTVVEIKMTRRNLKGKEVQEELAIDIDAYRKHSNCRNLVAFIYDPSRNIDNPIGFENDLSGPRLGMEVKVIVVQG